MKSSCVILLVFLFLLQSNSFSQDSSKFHFGINSGFDFHAFISHQNVVNNWTPSSYSYVEYNITRPIIYGVTIGKTNKENKHLGIFFQLLKCAEWCSGQSML